LAFTLALVPDFCGAVAADVLVVAETFGTGTSS
jgi:hypothetical protein